MNDNLPATFDEMYGNPHLGFESRFGHWKCEYDTHKPEPCFMCGALTLWIDLAFESPLCGPRCEKSAVDDANKHSRSEPAYQVENE